MIRGIYTVLFIALFAGMASAKPLACHAIFNTQTFEYPRLVQNLDMTKGHTIENLPAYLKSKLSSELVKDAANTSVDFVIVQGAGDKAHVHFPDKSSILSISEASNDFGAFNVTQIKLKTGKTSYFITNVNGKSRLLQVASFLKLAGISSKRIEVRGSLSDYHGLYLKTFRNIGHTPDLVIFGFSNTSFEALSGGLLKSHIPLQDLTLRNNSYAEMKWKKPSYLKHELSHMGVQVLHTKEGKTIWLIDNEYGDRAAVLMRALQDHGARNILLLGTAGALNPKYKVGDLVSPLEYLLENGVRVSSGLSKESVRAGTHIHVDSPALETKAWLEKQIAKNADFVDIELQKVSLVRNPEVKYDAYLIVSDVINSEKPQDYTQWTDSHRVEVRRTLGPILERNLESAGIHKSSSIVDYDIHYFDVSTIKKASGS